MVSIALNRLPHHRFADLEGELRKKERNGFSYEKRCRFSFLRTRKSSISAVPAFFVACALSILPCADDAAPCSSVPSPGTTATLHQWRIQKDAREGLNNRKLEIL
jgi:hypothetical protein